MTNWKYTDSTNRVVVRTLEDGRMESCLFEVLPEGTLIAAADPQPNPRIAVIDSLLIDIDKKKIRAITDGILKNDKQRLQQLEDEAVALRAERASL